MGGKARSVTFENGPIFLYVTHVKLVGFFKLGRRIF